MATARRPKSPPPATTRPQPAAPAPKARANIEYRIRVASLGGHRWGVTLRVARPEANQCVSLPAWIPGSYLIREFARHLQNLHGTQAGRALQVTQRDKHTWQLDNSAGHALELHYEVYAFDNSVRATWLDATRGFFNGTSLCLRVHGQEDQPHDVHLHAPAGQRAWQVATGLDAVAVDTRGFGRYRAADYDTLVDCPVEMGDFWHGEFRAFGVRHQFVVAGAPPAFDGERLLADARSICETQMRFWAAPGTRRPSAPYPRYVFLLNTVDDGYGGLEHRNSTALICARRDLPRQGQPTQPEGYTTLLGLISHEYFHTWNVKRLRPREFARYDYTAENYTRLLWFFEGFTSYYDDLLLRRAGLIDDASYLKLLAKTLNQVSQTPGQAVQSVAEASFDAWVKYYRIDENTPNLTVSYYTKGALVALCLDLTLRDEARRGGRDAHLDTVMRGLWQRCKGGPMDEADLLAVLADVGGRPFAREIAAWVHGRSALPLQALLQTAGVGVTFEAAPLAQRLGLRVSERADGGVVLKTVLRDGLAEQAGMAANDEWLAVNDWRLRKLDDLPLLAGNARQVTALVARDQRLLRLRLTLPDFIKPAPAGAAAAAAASGTRNADTHTSGGTWRLTVQDATRVGAWLGAPR